MGIFNRNGSVVVTDWAKTDPNNKLPQEYKDRGLTPNTIIINGVWFDGVSPDSSLGWEEFVWSEEPSRSNTFAFENMDDIDIGLVAQCQINFKYFSQQDFIKFREAIKQRYFRCTFFNVDTGEWEYNREMYCSKSERQRLHYLNPKLLGVIDFTISLVATNRDRVDHDPIQITYLSNGYNITVPSTPQTIAYGEQFYVANGPALSGRVFSHWDTQGDGTQHGSGWQFKEGESFTAFKDTRLYAVYKEA